MIFLIAATVCALVALAFREKRIKRLILYAILALVINLAGFVFLVASGRVQAVFR